MGAPAVTCASGGIKPPLEVADELTVTVEEFHKRAKLNAGLMLVLSATVVGFSVFVFDEPDFISIVAAMLAVEAAVFFLAMPVHPDEPVRIDYGSPRVPWLIAAQLLIAVVCIVIAVMASLAFAIVAVPAIAIAATLAFKRGPGRPAQLFDPQVPQSRASKQDVE